MHQLLPLRLKIWLIVGLAAIVSAIARWTDLGVVSLGGVVGIVEFVLIQLLVRSWGAMHRLAWLPLPAWTRIDLSGEWRGTIQSQWKSQPGDTAIPPIPAILDLHQGWLEVVFGLRTESMHSRSSAATPVFDSTMGELQFRYFYETMPTAESRAANPPQNLGSAVARVALDRPDRMTITYTNERSTGGDITLERVVSKVGVRRRRTGSNSKGTQQSARQIQD